MRFIVVVVVAVLNCVCDYGFKRDLWLFQKRKHTV